MSEVTKILREIREGKETSAAQLLSLVYTELKRIAAQKMAGEAPGNTLQPPAPERLVDRKDHPNLFVQKSQLAGSIIVA